MALWTNIGVKVTPPQSRGWSFRYKKQYSRSKPVLECLILGLLAASAQAAELKPNTAAAYDRYIRATEAQHTAELGKGHFLVIDGLPEPARKEAYARLGQGQLYIEPLHTKENAHIIPIPSGLVHHWVGLIFIPRAPLSEVLAVLQNYDNHQNVYKPYIRRSKLLEHNGNEYRIYLQFYRKSIVTVVINANFDVRYTTPGPTRAVSQSYSTRITEVENPDKPDEHELPVGNDHGYLWRLNNYWRIEEKDGGAYVQVESIGLSRSIPALAAWLINPLVKSIPRSVLSSLLTATREAVLKAQTTPRTTAFWDQLRVAPRDSLSLQLTGNVVCTLSSEGAAQRLAHAQDVARQVSRCVRLAEGRKDCLSFGTFGTRAPSIP